jgi:hypothetical protein
MLAFLFSTEDIAIVVVEKVLRKHSMAIFSLINPRISLKSL